jgi:putative transposase
MRSSSRSPDDALAVARVDQQGVVLYVLGQSRRHKAAPKRLLRKLLKRQGRAPRVMVTDKGLFAGGGEILL